MVVLYCRSLWSDLVTLPYAARVLHLIKMQFLNETDVGLHAKLLSHLNGNAETPRYRGNSANTNYPK